MKEVFKSIGKIIVALLVIFAIMLISFPITMLIIGLFPILIWAAVIFALLMVMMAIITRDD